MDSDEEQDTFHGDYPEFGAIFMSSGATKKECLRRRLLGLPSSQGNFVKQVKTGMILFLFEHERRELHGVFKACSDGAMNICSRAFSSSGMQFPAQVKFEPIWHCRPLSESEFSGAIKENYFSKRKFNFGLSRAQVQRLLKLFSLRKLKDLRPQRELSRSKEARPVYTTGSGREVNGGRSVLSDKVNNELEGDNDNGPMMILYPGYSFGNVGREDGGRLVSDKVSELRKVDNKVLEITQRGYFGDFPGKAGKVDAYFAMSERAGEELNVDIERVTSMSTEFPTLSQSGRGDGDLVMQGTEGSANFLDVEIWPATENLGYSFAEVGRIHDDSSFLKSDKLHVGNGEGDGFGPAIPSKYPAFFQSSLDTPVCPGMPVQETGSLIQDQTRSTSSVSHKLELPITSHSYTASYRDAIVTTTCPYDPDAPGLNRPCLLSMGVNHSSNSVQDCCDRRSIPSLRNQSYPLNTEPKGTNLDDISKCDVCVPFAAADHEEHSCYWKTMPLPGVASSEEMAIEFSGKHISGEPFLKSPYAPGTASEIGSRGREIKISSSYSLSPSNYPSFVIDRCHPVALQDKLENELAQKVNYEPFTANVTSSEELQCQLQCCIHPGDCGSVDHHEHNSFDHDLKSFETSEGRSSDLLNNRSVFSRLALNSDRHVRKNSTHAACEENDQDTSVDEVMEMLSESCFHWLKSKNSRPTRQHDVAKSRNKKQQNTVLSELDSINLEMIPKKSNVVSASPTEDIDDQRSEVIPFVDFKRRSELRKVNGDTKARANDEVAGNDRVSGGQRKRRKLIRPNFSENEPHVDKSINGKTSVIVQVSSQEFSVNEDSNGKRRKLVRPNFRVNEPCDDNSRSVQCDTSIIIKVSSRQCSISEEDASGSCEAPVGTPGTLLPQGTELSHVISQSSCEIKNIEAEIFPKCEEVRVKSSGASLEIGDGGGEGPLHVGSQIASLAIPKLLPQGTGISYVVYQSSDENENIETERSPIYEIERPGTTLKIGDGGKEPLHNVVSPIASLAIPYEDNNSNVHKDPIVNTASQDCHENSDFTVQESAMQIPKPNPGTANAFSEIECRSGNELELLPKVELCQNSGDLSIGTVIGGSRNLNFELQRVAKEVAICVDAGIGENQHGSSSNQSEASLDTVGCFDKQEPSQEYRSSKLSEASFGTVDCLNKLKPSQKFQDLNLRFGESLFILSNGFKNSELHTSKHMGAKRDVLPISRSNICKSSDIGTSKNEGDRKDVLPSSGGIIKCELKTAYNGSEIDTSKHLGSGNNVGKSSDSGTSENVEDRKDVIQSSGGIRKRSKFKTADSHSYIDNSKHVGDMKDVHPISGSNNVCASSDVGTSENVDDRKDVLQSSGETKKGELKTAFNQNTRLANEFELGNDGASIDSSERENQRLWSVLTSRLQHMKNAQQQ